MLMMRMGSRLWSRHSDEVGLAGFVLFMRFAFCSLSVDGIWDLGMEVCC